MTNDKKFWDGQSKNYDKILKLLTNKQYKLMYEFIKEPLTANMHVLEVGTGTGLVAKEIASRVKSIEATDFSEQMIATAKKAKYSDNINFSCADIFNLPFDDNTFDTVIAANILHIIPEPEKAMAEIGRVLKPSGLLIATTFLWQEVTILGKIQKFFMMKKKFPLKNAWNEASYNKFMNDNGFKIKKFHAIKSSFDIGCVAAEVEG